MQRLNLLRSRIRRFYAEHLAVPVAYGLLAAVIASLLVLVLTWAGWRGKYQPWGDPIPFTEALANMPLAASIGFVVTMIVTAVFRVRF